MTHQTEVHRPEKTVHHLPVTFVFLCLLTCQVFISVDLTDEIQYYYQIEGLLSSGRFFTNDLYVQQLIYFIVYPILKLPHAMFGEVGLVVAGRAVYAGLLTCLYLFLTRFFTSVGVERVTASFAALALCFAPSYQGLFAISYNTVSQIGWLLATAFVVFRATVSPRAWAAVITITGIAHPPAGIALAFLCAVHFLLDRDVRSLLHSAGLTLLLSTAVLGLILVVSGGPETLRVALSFTAGFSIGSALIQPETLEKLGMIAVVMLLASWAPAPVPVGRPLTILLAVLLALCALALALNTLERLAENRWTYRYTPQIFDFWIGLSALAVYSARCLSCDKRQSDVIARRLVGVFLFQAVVLVGTSSNAISQATGALSQLLPFAVASIGMTKDAVVTPRWLSRAPSMAMAGLFCVLTLGLPYRQEALYTLDRSTSDVPMFAGILLPDRQLQFFTEVQDQVRPYLTHSEGLFFSAYPGLYPVIGLRPRTCMIYNHSLGSARSENVLKECLNSMNIALIVQMHAGNPPPHEERMVAFVRDLADERGFECTTVAMQFSWTPPEFPDNPILSVCSAP